MLQLYQQQVAQFCHQSATLRLLLSSDTTGRSVLSEELSPSFFLNFHRSPEDGTCFFHLACRQVAPICNELDLELVGLFGRISLRTTSPSGCRATSPSGCRATFEPHSFVHSCFSEIFGGGRGDSHNFSQFYRAYQEPLMFPTSHAHT